MTYKNISFDNQDPTNIRSFEQNIMRKKKPMREEEEEKKGFEHELMKEEAHQLEMQDAYESDEKYEESEE